MSFITFKRAADLKLTGKPVKLQIVTVGGEAKAVDSQIFTVYLIDKNNVHTPIEVLGLNAISTGIRGVNLIEVARLFKGELPPITRPDRG